ncbi:MAG: hypothetical protein ABFE01_18250 [Phycisphaerales bacterium]
MGGKKKQTIGYRYYFSLHMGLGRGPVNEIREIQVGGLTAYGSTIDISSSGQLISINKPELFGGDKKEGGVQGPCYVYNGADDQVLQGALASGVGTLPAISSMLGGDVPNFRGVVTLWFDGLVCSLNPYPKEWSFRVRRYDAGWWQDNPWYPAKARVVLASETGGAIHAMNGAHILYEVNTNPEWGRGMPPELIDENSFIYAANQLCSEGLGLCIPWFRQENIKEFIPKVINHIGGIQYVDRESGKLTLRLIRGDYDPDDLPLFTPDTGLIDILDDDSSGEETAYNEIIIVGFDPTTKEDIQVRVQNLASIQSQGEIISNTIEYKGLSTRKLCAKVALRELKAQLPLRRMSVVLDRRGWRIAPGMPFRVSMPSKGIANMVLRAGEVDDGTLTDSKITVKAVQDIFGMPETDFIEPPSSVWQPPSFTAIPPTETRVYEINWRDFYVRTTKADQDAVTAGVSYVGLIAKEPTGVQTQGFDVYTKPEGGEYAAQGTVGFTAALTLAEDIGPLDTTFSVFEAGVAEFLIEYEPGMAIMIDDEQMELTSLDGVSFLATVKRGVADTVPAAHTLESTVWLIDDEIGLDGIEYTDGETVYGKALTRTSTDLLDIALAEEVSEEVSQRVFRPYPPGNVKLDGISVYNLGTEQHNAPVLTWAHRDRKLQADLLVGHTEGSTGPEAGVTYVVRIYAQDGTTLLRETDVGAVDTWTYDSTMQTADGAPVRAWMEIVSKRDGVESMFKYRFFVVLNAGWGYGWGQNWGGL